MQLPTLAKHSKLLLFIVVCGLYFYGLGYAPLVGPDEPRYAQVAREMFDRRDAVTPTLGGFTWFEKPALLYWGMMASYQVFGVSEWSARLPAICSGLLAVLMIGWVGKRVEDTESPGVNHLGLISSLVLASSAGLIVFSRGATFDIIITMTVTLALGCFFCAELETDERKKGWLLGGFYAGTGLSLLAKGLIGIVIPCGVVSLYFLLQRRPLREWVGVLRWWGPLLIVGVAALWYGPVISRHGWIFVDEFFIQHHFARYVSNKYNHPQPVYFYIYVMALLLFPWTPFLIHSLAGARGWRWRAEREEADEAAAASAAVDKLRVFAFAWLIVPTVFFSLSTSKLPGYVLPALPGAALLASERLSSYVRERRGGRKSGAWSMRAVAAVLILLAIAGLIYARNRAEISSACALLILLPFAGAGVFAGGWAHRLPRWCVAAVAGAMFGTILLIVNCALVTAADRQSVRSLLERSAERGYASLPVLQMSTIERTAEFYAAGRLTYDANGKPIQFDEARQVADAARQSGGQALVIVPVRYSTLR